MGEAIFTPPSGGKFSVKRTGEAELLVNGNIEIEKREKKTFFVSATVWWEKDGVNEGILRIGDSMNTDIAGRHCAIIDEMIEPIVEAAKEFLAMESQITPF